MLIVTLLLTLLSGIITSLSGTLLSGIITPLSGTLLSGIVTLLTFRLVIRCSVALDIVAIDSIDGMLADISHTFAILSREFALFQQAVCIGLDAAAQLSDA